MAKIPLYNTDIVPPRNRPELTGLTDSDIFIVEDLADNKIKKLTKANAKDTLGIDNIDSRLTTLEGSGSGSVQDQIDTAIDDLAGAGRTTETVKGNADAIAQIQDNKVTAFQETPDDTHYPSEKLVYDFLEAIKGVDYTDGTLKSHETRLDTLEADSATEGSVAKTVKDAVDPIDARLTGLDTITYDGTTYRVSRKIENGHLVTTYTEVV